MVRGGTVAVLTLALLGAGMWSYARTDHPVDAAGTQCPVPSLQYELICYPPQQKQAAQKRFAVHPVDPSHIVKGIASQPLSLVITGQHDRGESGAPSRKVTLLEYDFGPVPTQMVANPTSVPSAMPVEWTMVIEYTLLPHTTQLTGVRVVPTQIGGAKWELDEPLLVHHKLTVIVITTENRATAVAIGRALVKKDKGG